LLPTAWSGYAYWQYTSAGKLPGIKIATDISALSPTALEVAAPGRTHHVDGHRHGYRDRPDASHRPRHLGRAQPS
jgi:hypothetical protein